MHRPALVLALVLALAACASPATQDARGHIDRIAYQLGGYEPWIPEDVGYYLTREEEYLTVLGVSENGDDGPGRVRVKVRGRDRTPVPPVRPPDTPSLKEVVVICFDLEVVPLSETDRSLLRKPRKKVNITEIDCPKNTPPRSFRRPAALPAHTDSWLKKHLAVPADLDAARHAVQDLNLDPRIRQDVVEYRGTIGVALQVPDGSCLFARSWPGGVQVWSPWRPWMPPVLPSERACTAEQAASGYTY